MGEIVKFSRPDGKEGSGYYAKPSAGANAPGVVVIQEWWGVNDQIKGVADRLAGIGYRALVPDLYQGKVTLDAAEAEHMMKNLKFGDATNQDIRGAAQYLKKAGTKVGVMGFCMGGALTVLASVYVREVDAAVCWYGVPPEAAADTRTIVIPFQGHFARQDQAFPASQVEAFEARLREGKVKYELYWYDAYHAFGNEKGPYYNAEAAKLAWQRSTDFLAKHLK